MKIRRGEYAIIRVGNKNQLIRCIADEGSVYVGKVVGKSDEPDDEPESFEFHAKDVMCSLGKSPIHGSAFGVKIEPLVTRLPDQYFGEIRVYKRMNEHELEDVMKELKAFKSALKAKRVSGVKPILELRNPSGKYAGMYRHRPRADQDLMTARVFEDLTDFQYVLAHEYGHGVWFRMMTKKSRLRWVKLYHGYVHMLDADTRDLERLLDSIQSEQSISVAMRGLEDVDQMLMKECLRNVLRVHGLTKLHLDMMLEAGDSIEEYWPQQIELSEKEIAITEYGNKSPEEFFAEAFAHWFIGRKIPKSIQAALDKTMTNLIRSATNVG